MQFNSQCLCCPGCKREVKQVCPFTPKLLCQHICYILGDLLAVLMMTPTSSFLGIFPCSAEPAAPLCFACLPHSSGCGLLHSQATALDDCIVLCVLPQWPLACYTLERGSPEPVAEQCRRLADSLQACVPGCRVPVCLDATSGGLMLVLVVPFFVEGRYCQCQQNRQFRIALEVKCGGHCSSPDCYCGSSHSCSHQH